jgi:hypothetical protein
MAIAMRFLKKPENLTWVAAAFGGGLNNRDLCGFLSAGEMAIGVYAGGLNLERKAAKDICGRKSREFGRWWRSVAPLHCTDYRQGQTGLKSCQRLGKLAAAKIEDLIAPA